jgi:LAS superfamily LD-carboxypeptidase LdcB
MDEEALVRSILMWSALPGASRHHWGTEIDVVDRTALQPGCKPALVPQEYAAGGVFERLGAWLPRHCPDHGFFLPYDQDRGGVRPEPWHLSYAPVSGSALAALTVEILEQALKGVELGGAAVVRKHLQAIHARYVMAVGRPPINPAATPS